ncbi:MAG: UDP-3-O-acyl-N-acetylglucosamine deacetylase [Cyanobacteria bacterium REEB67]|nr:UDP-3-O-acyl-N-acetylglucosamine deacetylase [Cyanobacteria bacterium REEB67]
MTANVDSAPKEAVDLKALLAGATKLASYEGMGLTSKQMVKVELYRAPAGSGITFYLEGPAGFLEIPANASSVVNTMRNVVLGSGKTRLCIVEHFLCAASLWGLDDLFVIVDGAEMPLADGSAQLWIDLFQKSGIERRQVPCDITLPHLIEVSKGDRSILAIPDEKFSVTYLMDWKHPKIGQRWQSWNANQDITEICEARTFGMLKDHQMLGLVDDVVSLTEDDFTMPLRHPDEPVRHKLLDLIGDLALVGVNPLRIKARFISIKAGHELDVEMSKKLSLLLATAAAPGLATGV